MAQGHWCHPCAILRQAPPTTSRPHTVLPSVASICPLPPIPSTSVASCLILWHCGVLQSYPIHPSSTYTTTTTTTIIIITTTITTASSRRPAFQILIPFAILSNENTFRNGDQRLQPSPLLVPLSLPRQPATFFRMHLFSALILCVRS